MSPHLRAIRKFRRHRRRMFINQLLKRLLKRAKARLMNGRWCHISD